MATMGITLIHNGLTMEQPFGEDKIRPRLTFPATPAGFNSRFRARLRAANQVNPAGPTVILFDTENWDTLNEYNPATGRFTASVAGYYLFIGEALMNHNSGIPLQISLMLVLNALTMYSNDERIIPVLGSMCGKVHGIIYLAVGDFVFVAENHAGLSNVTVWNTNQLSHFDGHRLS